MTASGSRKGPRLSPEDIALWDGITRTIRPLRKRAPGAAAPEDQTKPATRATKVAKHRAPAPAPAVRTVQAPPPPSQLDRKTRQKIARGRDAIDARLDLHGYTQAEAHDVLLRFLRRTRAKGGRVVLVITGKGARMSGVDKDRDRGVLKRAVPLWLALPEFREMVIGFDSAATGHGGEGALYVRLRKA